MSEPRLMCDAGASLDVGQASRRQLRSHDQEKLNEDLQTAPMTVRRLLVTVGRLMHGPNLRITVRA